MHLPQYVVQKLLQKKDSKLSSNLPTTQHSVEKSPNSITINSRSMLLTKKYSKVLWN
jgi:hypothetical protein